MAQLFIAKYCISFVLDNAFLFSAMPVSFTVFTGRNILLQVSMNYRFFTGMINVKIPDLLGLDDASSDKQLVVYSFLKSCYKLILAVQYYQLIWLCLVAFYRFWIRTLLALRRLYFGIILLLVCLRAVLLRKLWTNFYKILGRVCFGD